MQFHKSPKTLYETQIKKSTFLKIDILVNKKNKRKKCRKINPHTFKFGLEFFD